MDEEKIVEELEEVVEEIKEITEDNTPEETETEIATEEVEEAPEATEEEAGEEMDVVDVLNAITQKLSEIEARVTELAEADAKRKEKLKGFFAPKEGKVEDEVPEKTVTTYSDIYKFSKL